ncbi:hypothetical protein SBFV1_gp05 [Sulfolobales Beppu filamentous phage 1]|uniref:Uncharacterized protein n=1 Tax=Sulfolobales Beppu filamentous phage 1 TaxID=2493122 RepID=A0A3S8NEM1_9VIRU|nr:hypothetical protein SBFV1_gp05 [Sulfolobales Beppu filamentous phage 1]
MKSVYTGKMSTQFKKVSYISDPEEIAKTIEELQEKEKKSLSKKGKIKITKEIYADTFIDITINETNQNIEATVYQPIYGYGIEIPEKVRDKLKRLNGSFLMELRKIEITCGDKDV